MPIGVIIGEALFPALKQAERAGQRQRAIELRSEILTQRLSGVSEAERSGVLSTGDCLLLFNQAVDLRALGRPRDALAALEWAQRCARVLRDDHGEILCALRMIQCCLDAIAEDDGATELLDEAGRRLTALGLGADSEPELALGLGLATNEPQNRLALCLEGLCALARYQAATGALAAAEATCGLALQQSGRVDSVCRDELMVLMHEIMLDRGDLAGCEALRREQSEHFDDNPQGEAARLKWQVLGGTLLRMRTRLTEADDVLRAVLAEAHDRAAAPHVERTLAGARWQRHHVLFALNRMEDAAALLKEIEASSDLPESDLRLIVVLHAAHRLGGLQDLPLTSREILARGTRRPTGSAATSYDPTDPPLPLRRTRERIVDDWARVANGILLDLHHSRLAQARRRFDWLLAFSRGIDSMLCAARLIHLQGLLAYHEGRDADADRLAEVAVSRYRELGLLAEEWAAQRLLLCITDRRGAGPEDRDCRLTRERRLLGDINRHLSLVDQRMFRLNKWSEEDRRLDQRSEDLLQRLDRLKDAHILRRQRRTRHVQGMLREVMRVRGREAGWGRGLRSLWTLSLPMGDVVLWYLVLPQRVVVFRLARGSWEAFSVPTTRAELWESCRRVLVELVYGRWGQPKLMGALAALAALIGLDQSLAGLPATRGQELRRLYIIPDDMLFHVPFAALPVAGRPLMLQFAPVLSPYFEWRLGCPERLLPIREGLGIAVERTEARTAAGATLTDRPGVGEGLAGLVAAAEGVGLTRLLGANGESPADRRAVLAALPQARVVQYAGHSDADPSAPQASGLALADGWLTVAELSQLDLSRINLAVLSSCFGASIEVAPGRELVGLPLALLARGVRAVICALWQVNADFNSTFGTELFRRLASEGPIEALANTQRLLCERVPPRDWAAPVIYHGGLRPSLPLRFAVELAEGLRSAGKQT